MSVGCGCWRRASTAPMHKTLRETLDKLKDKLKTAAIVLAAVDGGRVQLAAGVTADSIGKLKAGELVNFVAQQVGGKGGGKADIAMAGGTDPARLDEALASVSGWVRAAALSAQSGAMPPQARGAAGRRTPGCLPSGGAIHMVAHADRNHDLPLHHVGAGRLRQPAGSGPAVADLAFETAPELERRLGLQPGALGTALITLLGKLPAGLCIQEAANGRCLFANQTHGRSVRATTGSRSSATRLPNG